MPSERHLPFEQATNYYQGRSDKPIWMVVHDAVFPEIKPAAEDVQHFFAHQAKGPDGSSAHVCTDVDSATRSVHDWDTAWAAPGVNSNGLHLEQAGKNQNHRDWRDKYSTKMIEEQSAKQVADWHVRHDIALVKRGPQEILHRIGGVIGHYDATHAFHTPGGHTDPDPDYPWGMLLSNARDHAKDLRRPHIVHNPYSLPQHAVSQGARGDAVRFVQWALGIPVDGIFGRQTGAAVRNFQSKHGLHQDQHGVVGHQTAVSLSRLTHVH